jgi:hypothetical protein
MSRRICTHNIAYNRERFPFVKRQKKMTRRRAPTGAPIPHGSPRLRGEGVDADSDGKKRKGEHRTPSLHMAARCGNVEVVDKLLSTGASVDMQDKQGETALHLAARVGNVEVVSKLISAGASVDMQDNFQRTAFVLGSKKQ